MHWQYWSKWSVLMFQLSHSALCTRYKRRKWKPICDQWEYTWSPKVDCWSRCHFLILLCDISSASICSWPWKFQTSRPQLIVLVLIGRYVWVGPVPWLKVTPESFQVHRREVRADPFSQPPLALRCTGTVRLAELVFEVLSTHPPEKEGDRIHYH